MLSASLNKTFFFLDVIAIVFTVNSKAAVKSIIIVKPNQWSTTGLSKAVVCTVLSMEKCT